MVQAQTTENRLAAGDQVGITVSGIPPEEMVAIKNTYRISDQGTISLLYLNEVRAAGMKPSELERSIEQLYKSKEIYSHPSVNVSVDAGGVTDRVVFVNGEVTKVGPVSFRPGLTASRALAMAGGGTAFAKLSKTKLIRRGQVIRVLDLSRVDKPDGQIQLEPDDEIAVPD
jgi:polysaccharide export outer membrane protein